MLERGEFVTIETRHANRKKTFASFMTGFEANYSSWSGSTWRGNRGMLKKLVAEFGELPLAGITTNVMCEFK